MAGFFYTQNKQKRGPVSAAELKQLASSGKLQPSDQVMKEGSNKWVPAKSVKGLFGDRPAAAAPPVPAPAPVPEAPAPSGGSKWKLWLFLLVVLGGLGAGGYVFMSGGGGDGGKSTDQGGSSNSGGGTKQARSDGGADKGDKPADNVDEDPGSPDNAKKKMDAWKAFVDAFTTPVSDEDARAAHLEKCAKLLETYLNVPFDPLKFKDDAREITRTYKRKNLQAQYPGWEPRKKLDASIQTMMNELERGGT